MTPKDIKFIETAYSMPAKDWMLIDQLAEKADTLDARERLLEIARAKYHKEEAQENNI